MCYQVVERYLVCRCLYLRHSIDPCPAHGQRGHVVQEHTILVAYACSTHTARTSPKTETVLSELYGPATDHNRKEHVNSGNIITYQAISATKINEADTIAEILRLLIDTNWLNWTTFLKPLDAEGRSSKVECFLRKLEFHCSLSAMSQLEFDICHHLGSGIPYLVRKICENPGLSEEITSSKEADEEFKREKRRNLHFIQAFIIKGITNYVRNHLQHTESHLDGLTNIILKAIPASDAGGRSVSVEHRLREDLLGLLEILIHDLQRECTASFSPYDIQFITGRQDDTRMLETRINSFWVDGKPYWRCDDAIPEMGDFLKANLAGEFMYASNVRPCNGNVCLTDSFAKFKVAIALYSSVRVRQSSYFSISRIFPNLMAARLIPIASGTARIQYQCPCGQEIHDDYAEIAPGGIANMQRFLRMESVRQRYYRTNSNNSGKDTIPKFLQSLFGARSSNTSPNGSLPQHRNQSSSGEIRKTICTRHAGVDPSDHKYIHWCIPHTRYTTRMLPLQTCIMESDCDFFSALRENYRGGKSRLQEMLSLKKPVALNFVKFTLYHRRLVDIHTQNSIPPESLKDEYEYSPMPAQIIPPIGPNLLMHFFLYPSHAATKPVLLPRVPKRRRDKLKPCPVRGSNVGWGIDVVNGMAEFKVFLWGLVACIVSMFFGIVWSLVKDDIQGGFGVAGYVFVVCGFGIASLKASDL